MRPLRLHHHLSQEPHPTGLPDVPKDESATKRKPQMQGGRRGRSAPPPHASTRLPLLRVGRILVARKQHFEGKVLSLFERHPEVQLAPSSLNCVSLR